MIVDPPMEPVDPGVDDFPFSEMEPNDPSISPELRQDDEEMPRDEDGHFARQDDEEEPDGEDKPEMAAPKDVDVTIVEVGSEDDYGQDEPETMA